MPGERSFVCNRPSGRLWLRLRRALQTAEMGLAALLVLAAMAAAANALLPGLGLPPIQHSSGIAGHFETAVGLLFLVSMGLILARALAYGVLVFHGRRRMAAGSTARTVDLRFHPRVTVIVAARNQENVIVRTVLSVLRNGYEDLEVVVVDDGSSDDTLELLRENFGGGAQVKILDQPHRGQAAALDKAIAHASHEILIALDAATVFRRGAIEKLVNHFADPRVGAVSGNVRVGNRERWITRFESIEYVRGFNLDRRALDTLSSAAFVSGSAGAWRKSLVERAGGFREGAVAPETDLALAIRRMGYEVRYEEEAVAFTEAPKDLRGLARQRFNWFFGTFEAAWKHRDALFLPRCGSLGFLALPAVWIFQILTPVLSPFADIAMLAALGLGNWHVVLAYYLWFFLLEMLTAFGAYAIEREPPWDLSLLFFQRVLYRQLMYYVLVKSFDRGTGGRLEGWRGFERRPGFDRSTVEGT